MSPVHASQSWLAEDSELKELDKVDTKPISNIESENKPSDDGEGIIKEVDHDDHDQPLLIGAYGRHRGTSDNTRSQPSEQDRFEHFVLTPHFYF